MTASTKTPLEQIRDDAGLSRAEAAAALDMSERHLYRLEKGKQPLSRVQRIALADVYDVTLDAIDVAASQTAEVAA